jgi:GNAT superfamily N-acetyltransferase
MQIRPMRPDDVTAADLVARDAFAGVFAGAHPEPERAKRGQRQMGHVLATDPGGSWVAVDDDGALAGVALALRRDDVWGLSLLVVRPDAQARGIGGGLLDAALRYGDGARGALILSSQDPKAMRRYARAGFALRPTLDAGGIVDRARLRPTPGVRAGGAADVPATAAISRAVRRATHDRDVPIWLDLGFELLVHERGFAVHDEGTPKVLAALDDAAAAELLWACLAASPPGGTVNVDFLAAGQDWAVQTALEAGLALTPAGPLFVRGDVGPMRPYLPSGAFL